MFRAKLSLYQRRVTMNLRPSKHPPRFEWCRGVAEPLRLVQTLPRSVSLTTKMVSDRVLYGEIGVALTRNDVVARNAFEKLVWFS